MYVKRDIEARSSYHCCRGKAASITYSECVFVALVMKHAKRAPYYIVIYKLSGCTAFLHISQTVRFAGGKN